MAFVIYYQILSSISLMRYKQNKIEMTILVIVSSIFQQFLSLPCNIYLISCKSHKEKLYSLTENVLRLNIFTTYFAPICYFPKSLWFPIIEQKVVFQEPTISAKYITAKRKVLTKVTECIPK